MDKISNRALPAFAVGFALYYAPAYSFTGANSTFPWPLFTYFPEIDVWRWGLVAGSDTTGPPMWWYGWIAAAAIVGLIFAAVAMVLPEKTTAKMWRGALWTVPILAFVFLLNWELSWFIPGWRPISLSNPPPAAAGPGQAEPPPAGAAE
jgi:hypothetical protein